MTLMPAQIDPARLRELLSGRVHFEGDEEWETVRRAWNLAVDQRPAAIAFPGNAADVVAVVRFAREHGLRVAPQATGHGASSLGSLERTILLKTDRMKGVSIDPVARRARVEAGVIWAEVATAAGEHGLAGLSGSARDVGVVGFTTGGGMGWLGRRFGLAANSVLAADIVTADGELRRVDAANDPDLFWAIRGGGGSYGIVTALEFKLYPVPELFGGQLFWPIDRAREVMSRWAEWVETIPVEMSTVARLFHVPPMPELPEPIRGRSFVVVFAVYQGSEAAARELLAPMLALGPAMEMLRPIPLAELGTVAMDPDQPVPVATDSLLLRAFTPEVIDALIAGAGSPPESPILLVDVRHLGGALRTPAADAGPQPSVDAAFAVMAAGIAASPEMAEGIAGRMAGVARAVEAWDSGSRYLNFVDQPGKDASCFSVAAYERLGEIKRRYDPDDLIRANHRVLPD